MLKIMMKRTQTKFQAHTMK